MKFLMLGASLATLVSTQAFAMPSCQLTQQQFNYVTAIMGQAEHYRKLTIWRFCRLTCLVMHFWIRIVPELAMALCRISLMRC